MMTTTHVRLSDEARWKSDNTVKKQEATNLLRMEMVWLYTNLTGFNIKTLKIRRQFQIWELTYIHNNSRFYGGLKQQLLFIIRKRILHV